MSEQVQERTESGTGVEEVEENNEHGAENNESVETQESHDEHEGTQGSTDLEKELARLRKENKSLRSESAKHRVSRNEERDKAKTLEERIADLEKQRKADEVKIARERVSREYQIPDDLMDLLGDNVESMEDAAKRLSEYRSKKSESTTPPPRTPSGGVDPSKKSEPFNLDDLSAKLRRR